MKTKLTIIILLITCSLASFNIIDGERTVEISLEKLQSCQQTGMETHREKNAKLIDDEWLGVSLKALLAEFQIADFDQLKFTSADNYQVRLSKQEIEEYAPIIALQRNGKALNEDKLRLVVSQIRDMFWIQGIASITTEKANEMPLPHTLFVAEKIISKLDIISEPKPFTNVSGYYFIDLVSGVFPMLQGEFLLVSADGISHKLDFDKYLENAVLIIDDNKLNLQSPAMPGGMWIKNLAYIQMFDRVVFFKDQINNSHNLIKLLGWKERPEFFVDQDENQIEANLSFNDPIWQNVKKVKWEK
ncbi:MAG: molybdopterin-dependent oxidoreductase [Candidatus Cloacimonadales bacterium]|nr:molybdopterin-dependent oxidoreductase [Candidatus Cloacimonadales bacterium]